MCDVKCERTDARRQNKFVVGVPKMVIGVKNKNTSESQTRKERKNVSRSFVMANKIRRHFQWAKIHGDFIEVLVKSMNQESWIDFEDIHRALTSRAVELHLFKYLH